MRQRSAFIAPGTGSGPAGPAGPTGPAGPQGPTGLLGSSQFSRYTGTGANMAAGSWNYVAFGTRLAGTGAGLSLSADTKTITLAQPGVWTVSFTGLLSGVNLTAVAAILTSTGNTAYYAASTPGMMGQAAYVSLNAQVDSDGTATLLAGFNPSLTGGTISLLVSPTYGPRLTLSWLPA